MKCFFCSCADSKVIDSRPSEDNKAIRRRRECLGCAKRFTTYETIETTPIFVVKRDGSREQFDENKIKRGIIRACEKRFVSMSKVDALVEEIKRQVQNSLLQEIASSAVGELVMNGLKELDEVAYVRFASVYRQFKDISSFMDELEKLVKNREMVKDNKKV